MLDMNASQVTPLLVNLYDTHRIYELAKDKRSSARMELASTVIDLLELDLSQREAELITDILVNLVRQAERDLKRALAEKLSANDKVPLRLILSLANDEISVAETVLINSPVLNELDLAYIIQARGPEYWRAIAKRAGLGEYVVNTLADTRETGTIKTLLDNDKIGITEYAFEIAGDMATDDDEIATSLIERDDISSDLAEKLYGAVSAALREKIAEKFPDCRHEAEAALGEVTTELGGGLAERYRPSPDDVRSAKAARDAGTIDVPKLLEILRKGELKTFVAYFSYYAELSDTTVLRILKQRYGQGLAIACRGLGIEKADYLTIYLLTQRVRRANRIAGRNDIARALRNFEETDTDLARHLLRNSKRLDSLR